MKPATGRGTALVIDDDEVARTWLAAVIEHSGFRSIEACDGPTGLLLASERRPSVIVLDVKMPGMDGIEVARRLRADERTAMIPIIFLTSTSTVESRIAAFDSGAYQYAVKPIDPRDIGARLQGLVIDAELKGLEGVLRLVQSKEASLNGAACTAAQLEVMRNLKRVAEIWGNRVDLPVANIGRYSHRIASALGFGPERSTLMLHASLLHDIGIAGIPDEVLLKPCALSAEEMSLVRSHPAVGHLILSTLPPSELMQMATDIALGHHEKWDGSGYPQSLQGKDIPIAARIAAVADVFDALTSRRPYRAAWSTDAAVAEIGRLAGTHFDPSIVAAFMQVLPDIVATANDDRSKSGSAADALEPISR